MEFECTKRLKCMGFRSSQASSADLYQQVLIITVWEYTMLLWKWQEHIHVHLIKILHDIIITFIIIITLL